MVLILFAGAFLAFLALLGGTSAILGSVGLLVALLGLYGLLRGVSAVDLVCDLHPRASQPPMYVDERTAKIRRLVDYGATDGERAAAAEALRRMGA